MIAMANTKLATLRGATGPAPGKRRRSGPISRKYAAKRRSHPTMKSE